MKENYLLCKFPCGCQNDSVRTLVGVNVSVITLTIHIIKNNNVEMIAKYCNLKIRALNCSKCIT